jgi:DNA repair exonuclease SbcCD ATPase subunit/DNA repair exonuclease SbcCD nuclease subunit
MNIPTVRFSKLRRIIHLADIHIRLFKRHNEYREAFQTLYSNLKATDLTDTIIVVAGDIVHAKTDLSPEAVELASEFLTNLADLAPTYVIAGNHDFNQANPSRLDSLTPIIQNIKHPDLYYLKHSGITPVSDDVDLYVCSIIGEQSEWPTPVDNGKTKIALFHGPIHNAKTDVGYTVTNRHVMIETFDGFDIVILGDIHRHQILQEYDGVNGKPIMAYASSLIQQNHGETLENHGWCDWNVADRSFKFQELKNSWGYYTIRVENGVIPSYDNIPQNVRLRIFAGNMDEVDIKKLVTTIRSKCNVKELAVSRYDGIRRTATTQTGTTVDIHDVNVQNKLLVEFLAEKLPSISQDTLENVVEINKKLNTEISSEDIARNIVWTPISLKYDNLFSYGESNSINFKSLGGVVGIFAPNASGKTSIAEAFCFGMFDRTPRTTRGAEIMNRRKNSCYCEVKFEIDGVEFTIERTGKRNKKGEVKFDVDFYKTEKGKKVSLNGEQRVYTNQIIRTYVGDFEDFILTIFSSSTAQGIFSDRGQADRKDLLSQYMGLTILEKLYNLASDESKELAGALKRFKNDDFTQELVDVQANMESTKLEKSGYEVELEVVNDKLNELTSLIQKQYEKKIPVSVTHNLETLQSTRDTLIRRLADSTTRKASLIEQKIDLEEKLVRGKQKLEVEYCDIEAQYLRLGNVTKEWDKLQAEKRLLGSLRRSHEQTLQQLKKFEYDPNCQFCVTNGQSTINARVKEEQALAEIDSKEQGVASLLQLLQVDLESLEGVKEKYEKFLLRKNWIEKTQQDIIGLASNIQQLETQTESTNREIDKVERSITEYHNSLEAIETNKIIEIEISKLESEKTTYKAEFNRLTSLINSLTSKLAVLGQKKSDMLERIKEAGELEDKFEAYEAYLLAMGRDGLPYKLLSEVLPQLEAEVNQLLNQMVEFTVSFEADGKNINMSLKYDDDRAWPINLASGMEKFISGLAIRVALTQISSLPKSTFLIIDEGLGTLDTDNLHSIFMLFDVLRTKFDFILLISHIDLVRDISDTLAEIKRVDNFSQITIG